MIKLLSQFPRYYRLAKLFRFFIHHKYIYLSILRDLYEKNFKDLDWIKPRNAVLKLDSRCNAKCKFCYASKDSSLSEKSLSFEQWRTVIDQVKEIGCYTAVLSGGEPLINPYLVDIVKYVVKKRMLPFTTTNGIAFSVELIKELESAGLCAISFSVHGPEEHHDAVVGVKGAFKKQIENAAFTAKHTSIICRVSHVLTKESIQNEWYKEIWDIMRPLGVRTISLLPVCINSEDDTALLDKREQSILDEYAKNDFVSMDLKNYSKLLCPAAKEDLFINNFGEVQPCPFIPISFGNILKEPIREIFIRMQNHPMFEKDYSVCMPARDIPFINKYIKPVFKSNEIPLNIKKIDSD